MTQFDPLTVIRNEASSLIRVECRMGAQRKQLERAVYDGINKLGRSVDEVSDASGLTPAEVRKIAATARDLEPDELAGVAV